MRDAHYVRSTMNSSQGLIRFTPVCCQGFFLFSFSFSFFLLFSWHYAHFMHSCSPVRISSIRIPYRPNGVSGALIFILLEYVKSAFTEYGVGNQRELKTKHGSQKDYEPWNIGLKFHLLNLPLAQRERHWTKTQRIREEVR